MMVSIAGVPKIVYVESENKRQLVLGVKSIKAFCSFLIDIGQPQIPKQSQIYVKSKVIHTKLKELNYQNIDLDSPANADVIIVSTLEFCISTPPGKVLYKYICRLKGYDAAGIVFEEFLENNLKVFF